MTTLESFPSISLDDLTAQAQLLNRYDSKYIIHINQLPEIYTALSSRMAVLEHRGLRCSPYTTSYFDSAALRTYHDHLKGRRKRFKIRTRYYDNPTDGFLEIKIKQPRGQTLKVRWPYDVSRFDAMLSDEELTLINDALQQEFFDPVQEQYSRTLDTTFNRTTLFDSSSLERITIDTQLTATLHATQLHRIKDGATAVDLGQHCAIIEIKSPTKVGNTHRLFTHLGVHKTSISKYCAGLSAIVPNLVNAPWRESLRALQGTS